ncbi:hypothetical protein soil367_18425 (plasmid) [Hydrocarboniclastica marina]|uniref:Uncharacterized protein n=1 Tax=Hydrocarboniclastica marina TaxID=2259620 RepID=A0A4V1D9A9_9ALTE|nr:hypothetical protein soil367_18425 [Hydrocarboniclastica marina]
MAKLYFVATSVIALPSRDAGVVSALARVHPCRLSKTKGSRLLNRREAVKLVNRNNGLETIRFALGAGSMDIRSPSAIAIDYDSADALGVKLGESGLEIEVRKASYWSIFGYYLRHPDWGYRLTTHVGLGGLILGIIGAGLGVISFF